MKSLRPILVIFTFCLLLNCSDEEFNVDPKEYIIGKWESVQSGNWPTMVSYEPSGYTEFREDSVVLFYDYKKQAYTYQSTYWLTDSLLVERYVRGDGQEVLMRRRFEMKENWLRLDYFDVLAQYNTEVLNKIQ
jgi:hypothetical protein